MIHFVSFDLQGFSLALEVLRRNTSNCSFRDSKVDLVANSSSSLPSYVSPTAPDNALPLSEDPDGIFHPALH
ncbi:hypothetical protein TNCV_3768591 [Trichonephila clavipes]|nr:hypothetical protein TNCV_3768591 [Trichonephila clavipes]